MCVCHSENEWARQVFKYFWPGYGSWCQAHWRYNDVIFTPTEKTTLLSISCCRELSRSVKATPPQYTVHMTITDFPCSPSCTILICLCLYQWVGVRLLGVSPFQLNIGWMGAGYQWSYNPSTGLVRIESLLHSVFHLFFPTPLLVLWCSPHLLSLLFLSFLLPLYPSPLL